MLIVNALHVGFMTTLFAGLDSLLLCAQIKE